MTYIIIASILAIAFIAALVTGIVGPDDRKVGEGYMARTEPGVRKPARIVAAVVAGILVIFTLAMSFTTVDARAVGIQTAFGKFSDTLSSGAQLVAPWSSVEEFTTRLQTADLEGEQGVQVTFSGGGSGVVNAQFAWAISAEKGDAGAKALWEKYRDFDTVQRFVDRAGRDAVLNVANDYTPNDARTKQAEIAEAVKATLGGELSKYGVVLDRVSILSMPLDPRTQASLDKIVAAQNDEETAKSQKRRAETDVETAKLRESAGALSPAANQRYCLEIANSWDVTKNGPLPQTFNCALNGSSTPVIVGGK